MKRQFSIDPWARVLACVLLFCIGLGTLHAQEQKGIGFFNIINTIPLADPLFITVAGEEITQGEGLLTGMYTGKVGLKEGAYQIKFDQKDCESFSAPIQLSREKTPIIYVFYTEDVNQETGEIKRKIQARSAPSEAGKEGYRLGVLNSSIRRNPLVVTVNGTEYSIESGKTAKIQGWSGSRITIKMSGEQIFTQDSTKTGSYICILMDTVDGGVSGMLLSDSTAVSEFTEMPAEKDTKDEEERADASEPRPSN